MTRAATDSRLIPHDPHLPARRLLTRAMLLGIACVSAPLLPRAARAAQDWPSRPIRLIVPWAPGGLVDFGGRMVAEGLGRALPQPVAVENAPGAAGTLGAAQVANADPDGHTLMMGTSSVAIDVAVGRKTAYDPTKDLLPVSLVADTHSFVIVPPDSPWKSLAELIAAAKRTPGEVAYGTPGIGSPAHLFVELFSQMAGIKVLHVPYGRTQAINDLIGGRLAFMFATVPSSINQIRNRQVRALGVTSAIRMPGFPDIPTVAEGGVAGYEAGQWLGVFAPGATPMPIVDRLGQEIRRTIESTEVAGKLRDRGMVPRVATPSAFADTFTADVAKWRKVIQTAGIALK